MRVLPPTNRCLMVLLMLPLFLGVQQPSWASVSSIHSNFPHSSCEIEATPVASATSVGVTNCCFYSAMLNCSTDCFASFGATNSPPCRCPSQPDALTVSFSTQPAFRFQHQSITPLIDGSDYTLGSVCSLKGFYLCATNRHY